MLLGIASVTEPPAGAGFGLLLQAFVLALLSLPLMLHGMASGLIFTATLMLAVILSLEKAPEATQQGWAREDSNPLLRGIAFALMLLCLNGREKFKIPTGAG